ncbi:putative ribonuclease H-like domain-containing protein [Tanacetum coccineum]
MSARDKVGLGYGDQMNKGVLSYENEVFGSLFYSGSSDIEDSLEKPSFAFIDTVKHVKTTRKTVKEQNACNPNPKADKRDWNGLMSKRMGLGYGVTRKACFVCGSFNHLIRDCDFHEKRMAKQADLNKRMCKGTGQRENRPVWNNVQRVNHQNQFVPTTVLTRTGRILVNTARASSTNNVNTARHNFNSQAVPTNAARKVHTVKPIMNNVRPKTVIHKTYSPIRRPFNRTTTPRTNFSNQKVNTSKDNPQRALKNKGIVDSECSRHMTGNKAYLVEYQDYNGGPVAFGGSKGYITGKDLPYGKKAIKTKWVYRNKKDERGVVVRNKARLVPRDIGKRKRYSMMRFLLLWLGLKPLGSFWPFLHSLSDGYPKFPKKVYKVVKALYGLHQAPRAWYATLSTFLLKSGYRRGTIDKTLFIKKDKNDIMLV